jgi:hypothetical protein
MSVRPLTTLLRSVAALAVVTAGVTAGYLAQGQASVTAPAAAAPRARVVTLVTGERVAVTQVDARHITAALEHDGQSRKFQTLSTGTAQYVIPDEALPYVGRQLDLSLFNIAAPAAELSVRWAAGSIAHAIPGLTGTRVSSPAAFGAALASGTALDGVASVRPAGAPVPASPNFNLATLIVQGLDGLGAAAGGGTVSVVNIDDAQRFVSLSAFFNGTVAFSVPEGHYSLTVDIATPGSGTAGASEALVVLPQVDVAAPRTVVTADARTATALVPVPSTTRASRAEQFSATLDRVSASGAQVTFTEGFLGSLPTLYVTPVSTVATGALHWYTYFRLAGDGELYDVEFPSDSGIPAQFPTQVPDASLAPLDAAYHSEVADHPIYTYRASFQPWETFSLRPVSSATAPTRRVEYVTGRPDIAWVGAIIARVDEFNGIDQAPRTVYQAGQRAPDVYLRAPLAPGVDAGVVLTQPCAACRQGDTLGLDVQPWSDGGHALSLMPSATLDMSTDTRLYADGALVQQGSLPSGTVAVPHDAARLRLTLDTTKSADWTSTATRTSTAWTWRTTARGGSLPAMRTCPDGTQSCAFEPLLFVGYDLGADLSNAVPAGQASTVSLRVFHQTFDTAATADALTLDVSTDDGATWMPVAVRVQGGGVFTASVAPAAGVPFLSVRVHASDPLGDTIDQTITRAVRVVQGD